MQMSFFREAFIAFFTVWSLNFQIVDTCTHCVPIFYTSSLKNIDTDCKNSIFLILELMITIHAMSCDTYYVNLSN